MNVPNFLFVSLITASKPSSRILHSLLRTLPSTLSHHNTTFSLRSRWTDKHLPYPEIHPQLISSQMFRVGTGLSWLRQSSVFSKFRSYATHRELRPRFGGGRNSGWFNTFKVPIAIAGGVVAFDYFALPYIMRLPFLEPVRRNPQIALWSIIGLNVAGFLAWRMPGAPSRFMFRYGLLQKQPAYFNAGQMLGSAFSHQNFWHLFVNMFVLYQFGAPIAQWLGSSTFLECYLDSCVLSSLGSMILPSLLGRAVLLPSLGASGAVFSCLGVFSYLVPNAPLALYFIPLPIGAWYVFLLTAGYNVFAMASMRGAFFSSAGIDYAGHVAGSICGIFYGWLSQRRINERRKAFRRSLYFD